MRQYLENLFVGGKKYILVPSNIFFSVIALAVADSINPCTFAAYTALLLISLNTFGKKKTFLIGSSFIVAVFLSYFLIGLGLTFLFSHIRFVDKIVALFGLILGIFTIILGLKPEFRSLIPFSIRSKIDSWFKNMKFSIISAFSLGVLLSFTLLPCSSGPYIVATGLLSAIGDIYRYSLLILYNLIFIIPLTLILFIIIFFKNLVRKVKYFRSKKLGLMELVSGILLLMISLFLLIT
ncbi:MAG: hypothetical protein QXO82_06785 [Candidatus Methanomethylicia archaeon]